MVPSFVHALDGVCRSKGAEIGILIALKPPTKGIKTYVDEAGFYETGGKKYPRLQVITVKELLEGKKIQYPQDANILHTAPEDVVEAVKAQMIAHPPTELLALMEKAVAKRERQRRADNKPQAKAAGND